MYLLIVTRCNKLVSTQLVNPGLLAGSQSQSSQSSGQRPASSVNTASVISNTGQQCNDSVESDHRCKELTNDVKSKYK